MNIVNRWIAGALALLMAFPPALSAQENGQPKPNILTSKIDYSLGADAWPHITAPYRTPFVPDIDLSNSPRLDNLLRDGKLYLSLADAIALTIENNRFVPDEIRVKAGAPFTLVVTNKDAKPEEVESKDLRIEKVVPAGKTASIRVRALKPGTYPFFGEYNPKTAQGRIVAE